MSLSCGSELRSLRFEGPTRNFYALFEGDSRMYYHGKRGKAHGKET